MEQKTTRNRPKIVERVKKLGYSVNDCRKIVGESITKPTIQTEKSSPPTTKKASQPTQTVAKETPSPITYAPF